LLVKKLTLIFDYINGIATAIFIIIVIVYLVNNDINNDIMSLKTIGIIGGFAIVYHRFQIYFGKCILSTLFYVKQNKYKSDEDRIHLMQYNGLSSTTSSLSSLSLESQTRFTDLTSGSILFS